MNGIGATIGEPSTTAAQRTSARRHLAIIGFVLAALLLQAAPVQAAAPAHTNEATLSFDCGFLTTDAGTVRVLISVPEGREPFIQFGYWEPGLDPATSPATYFAFPLGFQHVSATRLEGSLYLVGEGVPDSTAHVVADFVEAGPIETTSVDQHFGNFNRRMTFTNQPMLASGSIALADGPTFEFIGCQASRATAEIWQTQPTASVIDGVTINVNCTWESEGLFVTLIGDHNPFATELAFHVESNGNFYDGVAFASASEDSFSGVVPLSGTGDATATVNLALARAGVESTYVQRYQDTRIRVTDAVLGVAGTVSITTADGPIELTADGASCEGLRSEFHGQQRKDNSTSHGAPVNDTPQTAIPLNRGGSVNVHTDGAALEGEAWSECVWADTTINPFVHTVWYTFVGTGRVVTLDTAGSDFDSAVAVYVADGSGGLTEVACGNDVAVEPMGFTLQGRTAFQTERGVTYFVQAGGYLPESGHLQLRVSQ